MKFWFMSCPDGLYNDISPNSVLLTFEDDYHLQYKDSTSYYNA